MDLHERLTAAYEREWGARPDPRSTDAEIIEAIASTVATWDDPSEGFRSWGRALTDAGARLTEHHELNGGTE